MKIAITTIIVLFVFGIINGYQEGSFKSAILGGTLVLASMIPTVWFCSRELRQGPGKLAFFLFGIFAVVTLVIYGFYIYGGASNPNGVGHMHIVLAPLLSFFLQSVCVLLAVMVIWCSQTLNKSSKKDALKRASS